MTMPKADLDSWRKRVDKKLNTLAKKQDELSERMDRQEKVVMESNLEIKAQLTDIHQDIHGIVTVVNKARGLSRLFKFIGSKSQKIMGVVVQIGLFTLTVGTVAVVIEKGGDLWAKLKSFIGVFNGNV